MGAVPIHHTATTDAPWDGGAVEKNVVLPDDKTQAIAVGDDVFAYRDDSADPTTKAAWWGPHHQVGSDGKPGAADVKACQSIVGILNGGMGGPGMVGDADKKAVYDHVAAHLVDAGVKKKDMPELKSAPRWKGRKRSGLPMGREFRRFAAEGLEVRSDGAGDGIAVSGMPIAYNSWYRVQDFYGEFEERMHPGVATGVLNSRPDVRFLFNHDGMPLARTASGTLTLVDTPAGLRFQAVLDPRQQLANDLAVAIERGDVSQMSCGFVVAQDEWNSDYTQRDIYRFDQLFDVSAVTFPASPTTSIELAQRMMASMPVESRARVRRAWAISRELREGKVLSAENAQMLQDALDALHKADDVDIPSIVTSLQTIDEALDAGQAGLAAVMHKADPDGDADDEEPTLEPAGSEENSSDEDGTDTPGDTAPQGLTDGTGSRSATPADIELLMAEAEMLRLHGRKSAAIAR